MTNKAVDAGWERAEGVLLYPANGYRMDHRFVLHDRHPIRIVTLDLNGPIDITQTA